MTREEAIDEIKWILETTPKEPPIECDYVDEWFDGNDKMIKAFDMAIEALEQEPKSEWQHDHEVLKAYSDGANDILDKIRAEIEEKYGDYDICERFEDYDYEENDISEYRSVGDVSDILAIIDKYKAEGSGKEMDETKFIITEKQILNAVKYALELNIQEQRIVDILMRDVEDKVESVLYGDCEPYKAERSGKE